MTDSRVSREIVQALVKGNPESRVSREVVQALVSGVPEGRVSRTIIQVMFASAPPNTGAVAQVMTQVMVRRKMIRAVGDAVPILIKNEDGTWSRLRSIDEFGT